MELMLFKLFQVSGPEFGRYSMKDYSGPQAGP
jgi:hypothetical protein